MQRGHVVIGATGHVGSALARELLRRGERTIVVTRRESARREWEARGAEVAVLDVRDVSALRGVFRSATRAFLLNPPADPASDVVVEERETAAAIVAALEGSELERAVALSTYGAQPGHAIGDLGVLHDFEVALRAQQVPTTIVRGAYFMSNWDLSLETARAEGVVHSFFPASFELPMVAPRDIAALASELLTAADAPSELHFIEGPERYTPAHVARAFSRVLTRAVEVETIPEASWLGALEAVGFSRAAAEAMAAMTRIVVERRYKPPERPRRGATSLERYIAELVGATS